MESQGIFQIHPGGYLKKEETTARAVFFRYILGQFPLQPINSEAFNDIAAELIWLSLLALRLFQRRAPQARRRAAAPGRFARTRPVRLWLRRAQRRLRREFLQRFSPRGLPQRPAEAPRAASARRRAARPQRGYVRAASDVDRRAAVRRSGRFPAPDAVDVPDH